MFSLVLVRARNPSNIGAVARAMHDFGFEELRLVDIHAPNLERARSAIDASAILASARVFPTVAEAVADCRIVVGTTAVGERRLDHPLESLAETAPKLRDAMAHGSRAAMLFGSEKTGLSNEELSYCQWLVTIPMHPTPGMRHASMNLGQAAAVCLYEIARPTATLPNTEQPRPALAGDLERVAELISAVLAQTGYAERRPASAEPEEVRRMVRRMGLTQSDARRYLGVLRQIIWKMEDGKRKT